MSVSPSSLQDERRWSYKRLFRQQFFAILFVGQSFIMLSSSIGSLALSTLIFDETGSELLTAWSLFGGPLIALLGSAFLLSLSDRLSPRISLTLTGFALVVSSLLQLVPGLPLAMRFVVLAIPWVVSSATGGAKWKALRGIVPDHAYLLGRSTLNLAVGSMQFVGFGIGGLLLPRWGSEGLFILAAAAALMVVVCFGLFFKAHVFLRARSDSRGGIAGVTLSLNRRLFSSKATRALYIALWVPNGLIVGCEALLVPLAGERAGLLLAAAAGGMMTGDILIGRFVSQGVAQRILTPLRLLLSLPFLLFAFELGLWQMGAITYVASIGYAASLPLQGLLLKYTQVEESGHVLGLHSSGLLIWQGVGATVAGVLAGVLPVGAVVVILAILSTAVTLGLVPLLKRL